jgi:hypothetical protein
MRSTAAVARAALREGIKSLPTALLDEAAMEIRILADHRDDRDCPIFCV